MLVCTKDESKKSFEDAIFSPLSNNGGLYCFDDIKPLNEDLSGLSYVEVAIKIIKHLIKDIDEGIFLKALKSYESFDDKTCPVKLTKIRENLYINELYHGPTRAFKDMALCPFGTLFEELSKNDKNYLIMCATSGDTGPATLNAFKDKKNIKAVCIYPKGKTSFIQERQMSSMDNKNLKVISINEDFDAAQNTLKNLLNDDEFKAKLEEKKYVLSAANSVNIGRILFQIIYHYFVAIKFQKPVNIIVPSGNFGNALACFYAKKLGANINKIKIISNENNILTEFFNTGIYDISNKTLKLTSSPAMDILISSNIERLLFYFFGYKRTNELYEELKKHKKFNLSQEELKVLQNDFVASFCDDKTTLLNIKNFSKEAIIDPHTATALNMLDDEINIICSTAEWIKFVPSMAKALYGSSVDELKELEKISKEFALEVKPNIANLLKDDTRYDENLQIKDIKNNILEWL